jgi:aminoacyl-tRNA hydrolase
LGDVSWKFLLAELYRPWLRRVTFIGVTGSAGKTITKDLTHAVLSSRFRGGKSQYNKNIQSEVVKSIFRTRPWDILLVHELTAGSKDQTFPFGDTLRLFQPQIGVVTNIGSDHLSLFHTEEAIAAEKSKLIAVLPKDGTAILNADDEKVLAMQAKCAGHVLTYGLGPEAMVRGVNVSSRWPKRLSFTVLYGDQSQFVQTQLCGTQWAPCVLAAIAVGLVMGVPLPTAAQAVQTVRPYQGRMSPVSLLNDVTFFRDDWKAPLWSIPSALKFLQEAEGKRKIVVMGTISDIPPRNRNAGKGARIYAKVARQALDVADYVFFVGPWASWCLRARRHPEDENRVRAYSNVQGITRYLRSFLEPGDLVLLKGSGGADHLQKIILALEQGEEGQPLNHSRETSDASKEQAILSMADLTRHEATECHGEEPLGSWPTMLPTGSKCAPQVVVGLGNWAKKNAFTPHNVGHRVVDELLQSLGGEWTQEDQMMVARVDWKERSIYLVKPMTGVNHTGSVLSRLSHRIGCSPAELILVFDDLSLPLGTMRTRMKGSSGGHKGMGSVIETFQTEQLRRVKIGVGQPQGTMSVPEYVLTPFSPSEQPVIDRACAEAADRILELVASFPASAP